MIDDNCCTRNLATHLSGCRRCEFASRYHFAQSDRTRHTIRRNRNRAWDLINKLILIAFGRCLHMALVAFAHDALRSLDSSRNYQIANCEFRGEISPEWRCRYSTRLLFRWIPGQIYVEIHRKWCRCGSPVNFDESRCRRRSPNMVQLHRASVNCIRVHVHIAQPLVRSVSRKIGIFPFFFHFNWHGMVTLISRFGNFEIYFHFSSWVHSARGSKAIARFTSKMHRRNSGGSTRPSDCCRAIKCRKQ